MFCRQCGKELSMGAQFCPQCGGRVGSAPASAEADVPEAGASAPTMAGAGISAKKKGNGSKKIILAVTAAVLAVAVIGAGTGFLLLSRTNNALKERYAAAAEQIKEDNIPNCQKELERLEAAWQDLGLFSFREKEALIEELDAALSESKKLMGKIEEGGKKLAAARETLAKYKLSDEEYVAYEAALDDLEEIIKSRDADGLENSVSAAERALAELVKANAAYVDKKLAEYGQADFSFAEATDIEAYNRQVSKLRELLSKEEYGSMADIFAKLDEIYYKYIPPKNYLNIAVQQIDVTGYPNVRLYLNVTDQGSGDVVQGLDGGMFFIRKEDANGNYIKQAVKGVNQLDQKEALNVDIVADVSGSMSGAPLNTAKSVMANFVNSVQFAAGDMVELISFSTGVYVEEPFTNNAGSLISRINGLNTKDMTAFYDALYTAVYKVASCSGAKCVIAFTDGLDNYSSCKSGDVIQLAQRYRIPIFIIGIGNDNFAEAKEIARQTGGSYYSVNDVYNIQDIYQKIYRQQKQLYLLEFEDSSSVGLFSESSIVAGYHTAEYGGDVTYAYTPHTLVSVNDAGLFQNGPEAVAAAYMRSFADAMTKQDYSYIAPYLKAGSPIAVTQEQYVKKGIAEVLNSYEIEDVEYSDANNCVITTRETYFVQKPGNPLTLLTQRCKYRMEKGGNDWKITDFAESVEVLSKIKY